MVADTDGGRSYRLHRWNAAWDSLVPKLGGIMDPRDSDENYYEESLIGSGESLLPAMREVEFELEVLEDLRRRNLAYPARSAEADEELHAIENEIAQLSRLIPI